MVSSLHLPSLLKSEGLKTLTIIIFEFKRFKSKFALEQKRDWEEKNIDRMFSQLFTFSWQVNFKVITQGYIFYKFLSKYVLKYKKEIKNINKIHFCF